MKHFLSILVMASLVSCGSHARERVNLAEDEASRGAFESGKNSGTGFGAWHFESTGNNNTDSHAGFFTAKRGDQPGLDQSQLGDRAYALYANGVKFEAATAFRNLDESLAAGDSFSLLMKTGDFSPKFQSDDERPGWVGFVLRAGTAAGHWQDYNKDARFEFGARQGQPNYLVKDGGPDSDTGVPVNAAGVAVTVTLVSADVYNLEITVLDSGVTKKITNRRLGGSKTAPIESFTICNQDGEKGDAFFNGLQVSRLMDSIPR